MSERLSDVGELELIERISAFFTRGISEMVGIGDDAAVLPLSLVGQGSGEDSFLVWTADALVENVHFRRRWASSRDVGYKLLATNISDLSAMGARPIAALLVLQASPSEELAWLDGMLEGLREGVERWGCPLLGGDTVQGPGLSLALTVLGITPRAPLLRSGAREGDDVWVSGPIGLSFVGFEDLEGRSRTGLCEPLLESARSRHLRPEPRAELGWALLQGGLASAAIDVSDGLFRDSQHLANKSSVSLELDLRRVPFPEGALGTYDPCELCSGGEDYELLFTAARQHRKAIGELAGIHGAPCPTRIGRVVPGGDPGKVRVVLPDGRQMSLAEIREVLLGGFRHF